MKRQEFKVAEATTLDAFIRSVLVGVRPKRVQQLLKFKAVSVNAEVVSKGSHALAVGDTVSIRFDGKPPSSRELEEGLKLLFEDAHLLVVDKPPGLLTIATEHERRRTAYAVLTDHVRETSQGARVFIVHRLDQATSGLLVFARTEEVKRALQDNWSSVQKEYLAVVHGTPQEKTATITSHLRENKAMNVYSTHDADGALAITHYTVRESNAKYALLEITLETGRKNQIRVHLADRGHAVVGDTRYGRRLDRVNRLALHASRLSFAHPVTGERLVFVSPMPPAMRALMKGSTSEKRTRHARPMPAP